MHQKHIHLLKALIKIKSLSADETKLCQFIKIWMEKRGMKPFLQNSNLVLHIKGKGSKKAIIFNSHMDTVTPGEKKWKYGPLNPTIVGKKLYGLGSSDMKSGLCASMLLAEKYQSKTPPVDLWFIYVVKEETDGSGTSQFAKWFKKGGYTKKYHKISSIITEPTNLTEIEHGNRGNIFLIANSTGDSGHSSRPEKIKNHSVKTMFQFSKNLEEMEKKWQKTYKNKYFSPAISVGSLTSINAGVNAIKNDSILSVSAESPNKFPSYCSATFDVRTTHTFHPIALKEIKKIAKKYSIKISLFCDDAPAGFTDPTDKIVKVSQNVIKKSKLSTSQGSSDMGFLTSIGISTIILGPGKKSQAHKTNEYCIPTQIPKAIDTYSKIISAWASN